MKKLSLELCWW